MWSGTSPAIEINTNRLLLASHTGKIRRSARSDIANLAETLFAKRDPGDR
jgi:hypothetical protein